MNIILAQKWVYATHLKMSYIKSELQDISLPPKYFPETQKPGDIWMPLDWRRKPSLKMCEPQS